MSTTAFAQASVSAKCRNCGLVNFSSAEECKRCGTSLTTLLDAPLAASNLLPCPDCGRMVSPMAETCPQCGRFFRKMQAERAWHPGIAAVLSFIIPGLGQMYKGQILGGLGFLFFTVIGYFLFFFPGLVIHLLVIFDATKGNPYETK